LNSVLSEKDSKKERFGRRPKALYDDGEEIVSDGLCCTRATLSITR